DALCSAYAGKALDALGWREAPREAFSTADLAETLGVKPQFRRMLGRPLEMLAEDGYVTADGSTWRIRSLPLEWPADEAESLLEAFPDCRAELTMVARCGRALALVLKGEHDPIELLFPGGSLADLEALYTNSPFTRACNLVVERLVSRAANTREPGSLRVLEI